MNIYEAFESNLVDDGKEFPLSESAFITLLPVGGDKAQRALEKMMEPYGPRIAAGGKLTAEENKALNVKYYSQHIVLGWRGLKDRDDKEIKFSKDAAAGLFATKSLAPLFALVMRMATNDASFEAERIEADEKN